MTERGPRERWKVQIFCQPETSMKEYICLCDVCVCVVCICKYGVGFLRCINLYHTHLHHHVNACVCAGSDERVQMCSCEEVACEIQGGQR